MSPEAPIDELVRQIHEMSRERCIHELTHFEAIPLDFRRDDLETMSLEWLRHMLLAAVVTADRRRRGPAVGAAGGRDESG